MPATEVRRVVPIPLDDFKNWLEAKVYDLTGVAADRVRERTYGLYTDMVVGGAALGGEQIHFRLQRLGERTLLTANPSESGEALWGTIRQDIAGVWPEAVEGAGTLQTSGAGEPTPSEPRYPRTPNAFNRWVAVWGAIAGYAEYEPATTILKSRLPARLKGKVGYETLLDIIRAGQRGYLNNRVD